MEAQGLARYVERITPFSPVKAQAKPGFTPFSFFGSSKESLRDELLQEATGKYTNKHHSNSERLVSEIPIIWLQSDTAVCDGGGGLLGHPLEYMNLKRQKSGPETCKYCGLRFQKEEHHH
ncbi:hypothetical protein BASA81_004224 [Batrachochytrium salamandrivorans]|nr:hypothetical protein BASA81_004224 [Batrachochytrium salamandrivorans]